MNCQDTQTAIDSASRRNPVSQQFSTHIAACPDCRRYSDQSSSLLALLSTQPRVEAPADFDFRLRARIARAESQPSSPFAFLGNLFGQSFSVKQAATSLAALAVMAAATTFYFTSGSQQPAVNNTIAQTNFSLPQQQVQANVPMAVATVNESATTQKLVKATSNSHGNTAKLRPAVLTPTSHEATATVANNVAKENMTRVFNRERGQVNEIPNRTFIGAEGSAAIAKPVAYSAF